MPNLSIKNVPEQVVEKLRQRAARHHRSLQGELMELICRSTDGYGIDGIDAIDDANSAGINRESTGWLSIDELSVELAATQRKPSRSTPLAVDIIRQERDSR